MYQDWLKLHRKIVKSAVFADPELFKLWVLCLVKANWKDCTVFWEGLKTPIHLKRGQFVAGRQALHAEYYGNRRVQRKSPRTVWRWLHTLQSLHNIRLDSVQAYTVVTICNYDTYQNVLAVDVQPDVQAVSNACPTRVQPIGSGVSTEEEDKNNQEPKEEKEKTVFPEALKTEAFLETWADWLTYRADNKRTYKSPLSVKKALTQLAAVGEATATKAINMAIANGWQGFQGGLEYNGQSEKPRKQQEPTQEDLDNWSPHNNYE